VDWNIRVAGGVRDTDGRLLFTYMAHERIEATKPTVSCLIGPNTWHPITLEDAPTIFMVVMGSPIAVAFEDGARLSVPAPPGRSGEWELTLELGDGAAPKPVARFPEASTTR
jgi:hypothetical protein